MSTNLSTDSGNVSNPNPAADSSSTATDNAAAEAAAPSVASTDQSAASGPKDTISRLDSDYKKNLLSADESEAVAEPEKSQPEQPEKLEAEPEEAVEVEEPTETDDLEEATGPRTLEALKKQFPRISDVPLKEIARVEAEHFKLQQQINELGGEVGLEIAKPLLPALLSPATPETVETLLTTIAETNPGLLQGASWDILTHTLNETSIDGATGKEIRDVTGEALVKQFIDPELSLADIFKFNEYRKAGLLDMEELDTELANYSGKSEREIALEARLKAIEDGQKQETAAKENDIKARQQQHIDKTETYVSKGAMERIVALADEYGWSATKEELASSDPAVKALAESKIALGELLTPWLDSFVKNHVKWAGVRSLGESEQAFNADGNPTILLKRNGEEVINAAVAAFKGKVRILSKNLAKSFATSRNAQLKAKTTRSGAVEPSIPPVKKVEEKGSGTPKDTIAELDATYSKTVREQRASL